MTDLLGAAAVAWVATTGAVAARSRARAAQMPHDAPAASGSPHRGQRAGDGRASGTGGGAGGRGAAAGGMISPIAARPQTGQVAPCTSTPQIRQWRALPARVILVASAARSAAAAHRTASLAGAVGPETGLHRVAKHAVAAPL